MRRRLIHVILAGIVAILCMVATAMRPAAAVPARTSANPMAGLAPDLPFTRYVLSNGLTLIVHEDHSAPLVAVQVWYHVGSKNEPAGRSGFAHLFEHLMFNGSENHNDDFYKATQPLGASDQNGTTSEDRTNYYQTVPTGSLDAMLWLESDRMGHLLGVVDQARLDEQRAVVMNERRQGENRPYAMTTDLIIRGTTPRGHPYDHRVIGSMEDLGAATLADVRDWFRAYYGPGNAVLVLAGDINPEEARAKVERYFGDIPAGPPVAHLQRWTIDRRETVRESAQDRVTEPVLYRVWNGPEYGNPDTDYLQLLAGVLAGDSNSRLYRRLVVQERLANLVEASMNKREIGGQFHINVQLRPEADPARVEAVLQEEVSRLAEAGPTEAEVNRVRIGTLAQYVLLFESLNVRAYILAENQTYLGDPSGWRRSFDRLSAARPADLRNAARRWLSGGDYVLNLRPMNTSATAAVSPGTRPRTMPAAAPSAAANFPTVERATLANGLRVALVRRASTPLVDMTLVMRSGFPADYAQQKAGVAWLALPLLTEGTASRSGEALTGELAALGAGIGAGGDGETSYVSLSSLTTTLRPALDLYADVVMNPAFRAEDVERQRAQRLANLASGREDGDQIARRLAITRMFGETAPYGRFPNEESVRAIDRQDLVEFHQRWFHPSNATLVVVGDTQMGEILPMIERAFAAWGDADVPDTIIPTARPQTSPVIYLVDRPGAQQSVIRTLLMAPPRTQGDDIARLLFNTVLGGTFTSRINMRLREERGWAYGASSGFSSGLGTRLFGVSASVQSDRTAESMAEISGLLRASITDSPITEAELANARNAMALGLSNTWSTNRGVGGAIVDQIGNRLPVDHYVTYADRIASARLADVRRAGIELLGGQPLTWVVVGDLARIEPAIRALGLGEIRVVDADGDPAG